MKIYSLICFLALFLTTTSIAAKAQNTECPDTDKLFSMMKGSWFGRGTKVFSSHDRITNIEVSSEVHLEYPNLFIHSVVVETPAEGDGQSREYTREYWIKPLLTECKGGSLPLEFISGTDLGNPANSFGTYDGSAISSTQYFGDAYQYQSETSFAPGQSYFIGKTVFEGRTLQKSEISYTIRN